MLVAARDVDAADAATPPTPARSCTGGVDVTMPGREPTAGPSEIGAAAEDSLDADVTLAGDTVMAGDAVATGTGDVAGASTDVVADAMADAVADAVADANGSDGGEGVATSAGVPADLDLMME